MSSPLFPWDSKIRPAWYDRAPQTVRDAEQFDAGPHIATERMNYTCPSRRQAFIELIDIEMVRLTVAAPVDIAMTYVTLDPRVGTIGSIGRAIMLLNVAGDRVSKQFTQISVFAGESVHVWTLDGSTGGTIRYSLTMKIVEFDQRDPKTEFYREPPPDDVQSERPRPDPVM